ncbi:hypothetical protein OAL53_02230 [Akkermansiaceae bacterium]|jgi:hypothetical protein|nr:hypothetical protein [Akkermansiaceae bacterium]MDA7621723.1 hypothetical protein [bacterium]MDA7515813.1 hypothetical protein [Akkermansiaceae bacterium]MDA7517168.1 hypothetical protein [Akkermansiaceae bacterium]MDA7643393.1 hypothetical protein [Akkermansiaceae bacterium]
MEIRIVYSLVSVAKTAVLGFLFAVAYLVVFGVPAAAFPPAPHYTLYGMVRDQVGQTVVAEGAEVILLKGGVEIGRTPITAGRQLEQNYELRVRIDQNRSGTTLYTEKAVEAQGLFSLVVEMNGSRFYPIEVTGNLTAGKGGERVKLDLNLGADSDGDGLPDVWEQWQLHQAGRAPDEDGNWDLHLLDKDGDFDRDGQSDLVEYIAGTFAGDATETFGLTVKEKLADRVRLEFFGIPGKAYTIESSEDGKTWTRVDFAIESDGPRARAYQATEVGLLSVFTVSSAPTTLYRITVR